MSKPRSKTADYLVYLLVRIVVCVLQTLSHRTACTVAAGLAWLIRSRLPQAAPQIRNWKAGAIWLMQFAMAALLLLLWSLIFRKKAQ